MRHGRLIGTEILAIGILSGAALAATPTKGDMDFCNTKAAQVSKASPVQPSAGATRQPAPSSTPPGTPVSPGTTAQPAPGTGSPDGETALVRLTGEVDVPLVGGILRGLGGSVTITVEARARATVGGQ